MMSDFTIPKYTGVRFKGGKLYLFSDDKIVVYRPWEPFPAYFRKTPDYNWKSYRPCNKYPFLFMQFGRKNDPDPILKELFEKKRKILDRLDSEYPNGVLTAMRRYRERHFHILSLLHKTTDRGIIFAKINSALFFSMASLWVFHPLKSRSYLRSAQNLIENKRVPEIVRYLGFNNRYAKSVAKLLKNIKGNAIDIGRLVLLRKVLDNDANVIRLSHYPQKISRNVFKLITFQHHLDILSQSLLMNLTNREAKTANNVLWDIFRMKEYLGNEGTNYKQLFKANSINKLFDYHDYLIPLVNQAKIKSNIQFSPPPIPGKETGRLTITPIKTSKELLQSAGKNHNCIFSHHENIAKGHFYAYEVFDIKEGYGNILLLKVGDKWIVHEAKKSYNQSYTNDVLNNIEKWVRYHFVNPNQMTLFVD